ncbi:MAG: DNA polymerase III subunit epsilon [Burkholderiales bacterium]|nr:MAG: DNA polymerase III subunit epsilon [Burkholderiales bacterium]
MRQVVLDTETTGLRVEDGHRIIEIAGVELIDRRATGRHLHLYVNPEREIDPGAIEVHGITLEMLVDRPRFADVAQEVVRFVDGAEVLIHNAPFDVGFLNTECERAGLAPFERCCAAVLDTLALAKSLHPGKRNSLDALCERYGVDNSRRTLHGALLDAELLAEVYLAMTRGQDSFEIALEPAYGSDAGALGRWPPAGLTVLAATASELAEHEATLDAIAREANGEPLWRRGAPSAEPRDD